MKRILLTFFLFNCVFISIQAKDQQSPTKKTEVQGRIIDAGTNTALEFATIALYTPDETKVLSQATSNEQGYFALNFPANADSAKLIIRFIGYHPYHSKILTKNKSLQLGDILIRPLSVDLKEVEIVSDKKQIIYKIDKRVIDASGYSSASAGTAVDILENTPSFRVDAEGEVTFRGSSGFKVYIDGKPSVFSGSQGLEQIPANQIANIEVITTPSARYETDGDVGIINIVTKKDYKSPLSGVVNVVGSSLLSRGINFMINQNKNKWNWQVGGNAQKIFRKSHFQQDKITEVQDIITDASSKGTRSGHTYRYTLNAGVGYKLSEATDFALDVEGGYAGNAREGDLDYYERRSDAGIRDTNNYLSNDKYDLHETYYQGNLQGNHKFNDKGHELSGRVYVKYGGNALEYFESQLYDKKNNYVPVDGHQAWESEHRWTVKANLDYVLPFDNKKGKFESGFMYDFYMEDGDYKLDFVHDYDTDIYSKFLFKQGIYSVYTQVSHKIGNFSYQVGLRGEQTRRLLGSSEPGASNIWKKFEFFPSAHIMYALPNEHVLSLGYSRRTTRPELFYMEPYITHVDYYTATIGNPFIRPEYTNAVELGYRKSFGSQSIAATIFHRARKDKIERVRVPYYQKPGVTLDSMANVGNDYSTGLELTGNFELYRWWGLTVNGSLYDYRIKNEFKMAGDDTNSLNWQLGINNSFNVTKTTRLQLDANYVGPSVSTQGQVDAYFYMNISARQQFFNRKLAATLALRDVLCTARFKNHISGIGLDSRTYIRPYSPLVTLSLSYTFNDFKSKKKEVQDNGDLFEGSKH
ncbi:MAG: outer membrane beta-barrel family protein [Bacteroidales bacterium]|nr:outer membrane beta-barrel family protein [Bacteroidales bacterium]